MKKVIVNVIFNEEDQFRTTVIVEYNDGTKQELFTYFTDELVFEAEDFLGLTEMQAYEVFVKEYMIFMGDWEHTEERV